MGKIAHMPDIATSKVGDAGEWSTCADTSPACPLPGAYTRSNFRST